MKIYKGQYGWKTTAHSKNQDGSENKFYLDVQFKKGSEPVAEETDGKFIFRTDDGTERECFFSSYRKNDGTVVPKMVVLDARYPKVERPLEKKPMQTTLSGSGRDVTGHVDVEIDPDELPFY